MSFNKLFAYLARRGKIDAYKEGDILFTTEDAVKNHVATRKRVR